MSKRVDLRLMNFERERGEYLIDLVDSCHLFLGGYEPLVSIDEKTHIEKIEVMDRMSGSKERVEFFIMGLI